MKMERVLIQLPTDLKAKLDGFGRKATRERVHSSVVGT